MDFAASLYTHLGTKILYFKFELYSIPTLEGEDKVLYSFSTIYIIKTMKILLQKRVRPKMKIC